MPTYPTYKLGDVAEILDSFRKPINSTERAKRIQGKSENELYPYYGATGQVGLIDEYLIDGEYVLVGEDGAPFLEPFKNKSYIIKSKAWVNNHAHILSGKKGVSCNQYLNYYLNSFDYRDYVNGTTRLKLTQGNLVEIPIPLPPLPTQHQIVSRIESLFAELDKAVEHLRTAQQQLKIYRQAVLNHWLNNDDGKWEMVKLGEVAEMCLGKMLDKNKNKGTYQPYLRNVNVRWGSFDLDDLLEMKFEESEQDRYGIQIGDLIMCEGGEPGRCAIWNATVPNMKIQKALHRIRVKDLIYNKFVYYLFSLYAQNGRLEKYFTGTTIKHLTGQSLKTVEIPLPSLSDQHRIVQEIESRLSQAEASSACIENALQQAEALRQSILKKAFSGELVQVDL
jgi:type I restriction enzyme S subunit